jgi:KUP system potassium uptake protein
LQLFFSINILQSHSTHHKLSFAGLLVTLGIIFGDIGTSPLYVMKAAIGQEAINIDFIYGIISCILWTLTLQTTIKYVVLLLQADNKGEGGIFFFIRAYKAKPKVAFVSCYGRRCCTTSRWFYNATYFNICSR